MALASAVLGVVVVAAIFAASEPSPQASPVAPSPVSQRHSVQSEESGAISSPPVRVEQSADPQRDVQLPASGQSTTGGTAAGPYEEMFARPPGEEGSREERTAQYLDTTVAVPSAPATKEPPANPYTAATAEPLTDEEAAARTQQYLQQLQ